MRFLKYAVLLALFLSSYVSAENTEKQAQDEPYETKTVQTDDYLEQEITIVEGQHSNRVEYRINGMLYAVKIIPTNGVSYFLVDQDGDGEFTNAELQRQSRLKIPRWVIFRF